MLGVDGVSDFNALHSRKHDADVQRYAFDAGTPRRGSAAAAALKQNKKLGPNGLSSGPDLTTVKSGSAAIHSFTNPSALADDATRAPSRIET